MGTGAGGRRWPAARGGRARGRRGDAGRAAAGAAEPRPWARRPGGPLLAGLALLAEALVGYVLAMLVLRSLCALPGSMGRLANRAALLASPVVVRRLLDVLVGGTLLAQATLATMPELPSGPRSGAVHGTQTVHTT